jgi:head-tail adaptor
MVIGRPGLRKQRAQRWRVQVATVKRGTPVEDPYGGRTEPAWPADWTTVATYAARYEPSGQQSIEGATATQISGSVQYDIWLPPTADVGAGDRIQLDGKVFEVIGMADRTDKSSRIAVSREVT